MANKNRELNALRKWLMPQKKKKDSEDFADELPQEEILPIFELPKNPEFTFQLGTCYTITDKPAQSTASDIPVFKYEGKQGIHHCFREIHGGWSRTYTDNQLVEKRIKEVKE